MKILLIAPALFGTLALSLPVTDSAVPSAQDPQAMAEMMKKAQKYTQPSEHHKLLSRFLGKWDTEVSVMGQKSKGTAEWSWLMKGRMLQGSAQGTMMNMPMTSHYWMGHDNFRMSYVMSMASNMDTALRTAEGDLTQHQDALIMYGTVDEYLTGEHDKMAKYVFRFRSDDEIVLEVHDLAIGENNTKVVEVVYKRAQ